MFGGGGLWGRWWLVGVSGSPLPKRSIAYRDCPSQHVPLLQTCTWDGGLVHQRAILTWKGRRDHIKGLVVQGIKLKVSDKWHDICSLMLEPAVYPLLKSRSM